MINSKTPDEILIDLAKNNDEEAFNMLLFKWNGVISMLCARNLKSAKKYGITFHELKNAAQYGVYCSLKYFNKSKSNFKTYLNLIVNQAIKKCIKNGEIVFFELSACVSFDENAYDDSLMQLDEVIPDPESSTVEWYINNEQFENFENIDEEDLSKEDKMIMYLKASGYTYKEVAKKLNISKTHTDFILKKIKKTMRK